MTLQPTGAGSGLTIESEFPGGPKVIKPVTAPVDSEGDAVPLPTPTVTVDWTILNDTTVAEALPSAAQKVANTFSGVITAEDLHQEGALWLATNADEARALLSHDPQMGPRALYMRIHSRLFDVADKEARVSNRNVPLNDGSSAGDE